MNRLLDRLAPAPPMPPDAVPWLVRHTVGVEAAEAAWRGAMDTQRDVGIGIGVAGMLTLIVLVLVKARFDDYLRRR